MSQDVMQIHREKPFRSDSEQSNFTISFDLIVAFCCTIGFANFCHNYLSRYLNFLFQLRYQSCSMFIENGVGGSVTCKFNYVYDRFS